MKDEIKDAFYTDHITKKVNPKRGVGIKFKTSDGTKYITQPRDNDDFHVTITTSTWMGISWNATHYYGRLKISDLSVKTLSGSNKGEIIGLTCREFPEEAKGFDLEVRKKAKANEYSLDMYGRKKIRAKRGELTNCFTDKKELLETLGKEFNRLFSGKWKPCLPYRDTIFDFKKKIEELEEIKIQ